MKIHIINAEDWKIDGGSMFGMVPKTIWGKVYPSDENNNITMSNRLMLIENQDRLILIDTGMGFKRGEKFYKHKYIQEENSLEKSLKAKGFSKEDITDVLLTHLHDDHCGGATFLYNNEVNITFPNATHWVTKSQWNWAIEPNKREAGAYFKDNFVPILEAGKLKFIEKEGEHIPGIYFRIYNGHTEGNIVPVILYKEKEIAFMGDFIPFLASIPLPYIAAADIQPLNSLTEKEAFLKEAVERDMFLFFEHDYYNEVCTVQKSEKYVSYKNIFKLNEIL